jgi:hypothetical protein
MFMHYPPNEKLEMIQEYHTKQAPTIIASKTSPSSYLNKAVISLDYRQMGNVVMYTGPVGFSLYRFSFRQS